MLRPWARRLAAAYLALFFVAVAAAPHHHLNGLEDLLLDQPSDSGMVVESGSQDGYAGVPAWNTYWLVDDYPCLACFNADFVAAPAPSVAVIARLEILEKSPTAPAAHRPPLLSKDASSRAPPPPA